MLNLRFWKRKLKIMKFCLSVLLLLSSLNAALESTSTLINGGEIMLGYWRKYITNIDGPRCSFRPTCSEYARQAIRKYGFGKGSIMASERLQRCNGCHNYSVYQLTEEGYCYDPVTKNVY